MKEKGKLIDPDWHPPEGNIWETIVCIVLTAGIIWGIIEAIKSIFCK